MTYSKLLFSSLLALSLTACSVSSRLNDYYRNSPTFNYSPPIINLESEVIDAFPQNNFSVFKDSLNDKKLALALITQDYDTNGVTSGIEKVFQEGFDNIPNYELLTMRVKDFDEFFNALRDYSIIKPIDALILVMHGNDEDIAISYHERIATYNADRLLTGYSSTIAPDGVVILYSCNAGTNSNGVATKIADALNRDVQAFKSTYFPEVYLDNDSRSGEFIVDKNNRLSINIDALKIFESISNNGYEFCPAIGTVGFKNFNGENVIIDSTDSPVRMIDK